MRNLTSIEWVPTEVIAALTSALTSALLTPMPDQWSSTSAGAPTLLTTSAEPLTTAGFVETDEFTWHVWAPEPETCPVCAKRRVRRTRVRIRPLVRLTRVIQLEE